MCFLNLIFVVISIIILSTDVSGYPTFSNETSKPRLNTRADWGADLPHDVELLKTPVPYVVIHHTYIPAACFNKTACCRAMKAMQNYHNSLGWGDIGYNFCVGSEGGAYEGRGWDTRGIHALQANAYSIGICLIGDWRVESPPSEQLETTKFLISEGVSRGTISPDYKLIGHNQVSATECPGTALLTEISGWPHFSAAGFKPKKV